MTDIRQIFVRSVTFSRDFHTGYSTVYNAFVLHSLVSKSLSKKQAEMYVAFIDFIQFAKINRKLLESIKGIYSNVRSCVRANGQMSEYYKCPRGLKQDCLAFPQLIAMFINEIATHLQNTSDLTGIQLMPNDTEIFL